MRIVSIFLLLASFTLINCTYRFANVPKLNMVAADPIKGDTFSMADYELTNKEITGKDTITIVLFFPLQSAEQAIVLNRIKRAVRNACAKNNNDLMTNVRVYGGGYYVPLLFGQFHITIKGEGWTKKARADLMREFKKTPELAEVRIIEGAHQ